ncbi:uncharacterized protein I303_102014 [Kwoniella dejecticola CBS 10117]|uniref:F-box domain-containing protein n=1 Tax=Kwoniella dejecticola CBS 10117 TaxID=1296121 RepID=A0A1A6AC63_9TREE|nr:uncharacterized protein I303_01848 [Kwoniella dejecticola CBS 10117]OBR87640.1 hypothetical protein I303_01848 [Kwoniella dejecticola CBS 10117]
MKDPNNGTDNLSLAPLPDDLLHRILSLLSACDIDQHRSTLASCILVSKQFSAIATPLLWRNYKPIIPPPCDPTEPAPIDLPIIDTSIWNDNLFRLVKVFSVSTHDDTWCRFSRPRHLELPNLEVLRIQVRKEFAGWRDYHSTPSPSLPTSAPASESTSHSKSKSKARSKSTRKSCKPGVKMKDDNCDNKTPCKLIKGLKPRIVVYEGTSLNCLWPGANSDIPQRVWSQVEILVFIVSAKEARYFHMMGHVELPERKYLGNLKKVYWIFDPTLELGESHVPWLDGNGSWKVDWAILMKIFMTEGVNCHFIVVNSAATSLGSASSEENSMLEIQEKIEERFRRDYEDKVRDGASDPEEEEVRRLLDRLDLVKFISLDEFVEKARWWEFLDLAELERLKEVKRGIEARSNL